MAKKQEQKHRTTNVSVVQGLILFDIAGDKTNAINAARYVIADPTSIGANASNVFKNALSNWWPITIDLILYKLWSMGGGKRIAGFNITKRLRVTT